MNNLKIPENFLYRIQSRSHSRKNNVSKCYLSLSLSSSAPLSSLTQKDKVEEE
jgi:hypothetical protein